MEIDWFPLWLSLKVAATSTLLAFAGGLALAYRAGERTFRGRDALEAVVTLPLVLPPTVLGYYLLIVLGRDAWLGRMYEQVTGSPLVFTWQGAVLAALLHSAPLLIKTLREPLWKVVDHSYERAARIARRIRNGVCSGGSRCHSHGDRSWRERLCALRDPRRLRRDVDGRRQHSGRTQTVAVAIYDAVESGNGQVARVLVLVVSAIALADPDNREPSWRRLDSRAIAGPMIQAALVKQFPAGTGFGGILAGCFVRSAPGRHGLLRS